MSTTAPTGGTTIDDPRFWEFGSLAELARALGEYTALLDGTLVRRYGEERIVGGEPPPTPEEIAEYEDSVRRCRSTIDIAMEQMEPHYPTWHRVIDLYYRWGLSCEPRGWLLVMRRLGLRTRKCPPAVRCTIPAVAELEQGRLDLPKCRRMHDLCCAWDYDTFWVQVARSIEALWRAIEGRTRWTPDA